MNFDPSLPDDRVNVSDRSAHREALLLVAGVAGLTALLAIVLGGLIDLLLPILPAHVEHKVFAGMWDRLGDTDEVGEASEVQALTDRLAAHWHEYDGRFRVGIVETDEPNAFALPGGAIMVTSGLLEDVTSENELAFVIGHELGHFRNRDHLRGLGRGVAWSLVIGALGLGSGDAASLAGLAGSLAQRGFGRNQEHEADRFGLWILDQEYGHANGSVEVFEGLLVTDSEDRLDEDLSRYLSTHPANPDRIADLRSEAASLGVSLEGELTAWSLPEAISRR